MAIYNRDTLPEADNLIEMTRQELYESADFDYEQKTHLFRAMDFIEAMGLSLYSCPERPRLYISDGEVFSEVLNTRNESLETTTYTLEFMCALSRQSKESLERRVEALERAVFPDGEAISEDSDNMAKYDGDKEKKLAKLQERALAIGNNLEICTEDLLYVRRRRNCGKHTPFFFTMTDAFDPKHKWHKNGIRWHFSLGEIDKLESFIAHDEEIYHSHFPDERS